VEKTYGNKDTVSLASWFPFGIGMTVIIQAKGRKEPKRNEKENDVYISMGLKNRNDKEGMLRSLLMFCESISAIFGTFFIAANSRNSETGGGMWISCD
jgi:hypothetical protein